MVKIILWEERRCDSFFYLIEKVQELVKFKMVVYKEDFVSIFEFLFQVKF